MPASNIPNATWSRAVLCLAATLTPTLAGCQPVQQPPDTIRLPNGNFRDHVDTSKPLKFHRYHLGAGCYDTYGCRIKYGDGYGNGYIVQDDPDEKEISSAEIGENYLDGLHGGWIDPPWPPQKAWISWQDKNRQPLEAMVDLDEIFKDRLILHKVPREHMPPVYHAWIIPEIMIEVNDRTVRVWMRAMIFTTVLRKPDNPHSNFRNDIMLAYEKTY